MPRNKKKQLPVERTVRIDIRNRATQTLKTEIFRYLQKHEFVERPDPNKYEGDEFLNVVLVNKFMVAQAVKQSPHSTPGGVRFSVQELQRAAPDRRPNLDHQQNADRRLNVDHRLNTDQRSRAGNSYQYIQGLKTEAERIDAVIPHIGDLESLSEQMIYVHDALSLTQEDHRVRQDFIRRLEGLFRRALSRDVNCCFLYAFGSSVNRLGIKNCDLDLVLTTNGEINAEWPGLMPNAKKLIQALRGMLYREGRRFGLTNIVPISHARIPLIKFKHEHTDIDCDISFNRRMGVLNSELIANVMEFSENARLLAFAVRLWGKQKGFVGGGGAKLNSYTITLMVIFYLQRENVLPPLILLKHEGNTIIDAYEGESFYSRASDFDQFRGKMANYSLDYLFKGFIEYYIRFSYETSIISVLHGEPVTTADYHGFNEKFINVQDPFETLYNTAKGVQQPMKRWFSKCLIDAWVHEFKPFPIRVPGKLWGLQQLFQSLPGPGQQTKGHKKDNSTCSGRFVSLAIPHSPQDRRTVAYIRVCTTIVQILQRIYELSLEVNDIATHPLNAALQELSHRSQGIKRTASWDSEADSAAKRTRREELVSRPGTSKDGEFSQTICSTASGNIAASSKSDEMTSIARPQELSTIVPSSGGIIGIEYYVPFKVQLGTRCRRLRDTSILHADSFDYDKYVTKVGEFIKSDKNTHKLEFTVSFQPHNHLFDTVDLEITDMSTHFTESLTNHFSRALPVAIERELGWVRGSDLE